MTPSAPPAADVHSPAVAALMAVAALLTLGCTRPLPGREPASSPGTAAIDPAILVAAEAYVRSHSNLTGFVVERPVVSGEYARVRVVPATPGAPAEWVYLLRQGDDWQGLSMSDRFTPAAYELFGIPNTLRLPAATPTPAGR